MTASSSGTTTGISISSGGSKEDFWNTNGSISTLHTIKTTGVLNGNSLLDDDIILKKINNQSIIGTGNIEIDVPDSLRLYAGNTDITDNTSDLGWGEVPSLTISGYDGRIQFTGSTADDGGGITVAAYSSSRGPYINFHVNTASSSLTGLMPKEDKIKLDNLFGGDSTNYASKWTDCSNKPSGLILKRLMSIGNQSALYLCTFEESGQSSSDWELMTDNGNSSTRVAYFIGSYNDTTSRSEYSALIILPDWSKNYSNTFCVYSYKFQQAS